ncbi:MAG: hypothetical protein P8X79_22475 [Reinekea sp.]
MNKLAISILCSLPIFSFSDFKNLQGQTITDENESKLYYSSIPYAVARQGQREVDSNSLVVGFSEVTDRVFSISTGMQLVSTKKEGRDVIGNWPLTPWDQYLTFQEEQNRFSDNALNDVPYAMNLQHPIGCLESTPLRYGDLENDGKNELVLHLGDDLVIFSPYYQRTVFAVNLNLADWLNTEGTEFLYTDEFGNISKPETEPQYASGIANTIYTLVENIPSYRGYAKLYEGDFDKNGAADIIVWQKIYESKLENDSERGFTLLRNHFVHYERDLKAQAESDAGVTGEYLPQETTEVDIKSWLSENNLTWSKGYPSVSECTGEEGKLIPEMHDPLLNDPEVLQ